MLSLLRFPALAKLALGGAAGTMLLAGAALAGPSVLAANTNPTTTAATGRHHHADRGDRKVAREAYLDATAAVLKMDPKDLRTALKSGRSLEEIASEHGYATKEGFAKAVSEAVKKPLDGVVDAGKLTRAEADRFQDRLAHGHLPFWTRHHKK